MIAEETQAPTLRVVWADHVREMSDLDAGCRADLMAVVWAAEETLRVLLKPDKINLASLGNQVPHVHWHVIARFTGDPWFPDTVWSSARRTSLSPRLEALAVEAALESRLGPGD